MKKNIFQSCEIRRTVPFHDLDPLNIVWHGNYLKYFDQARFELFAKAGIDLHAYYLNQNYLFPVTKTSTKYILPLQHRDDFTCRATIIEARMKIVMDFEIRRTQSKELCTRGRSEQVAVKYPEQEIMFDIPRDIASALGLRI